MGREPSEIVRRELTAYRPNMLPPPSPPAKSPSPNRNPIARKKVSLSRRLFPLGSAFRASKRDPGPLKRICEKASVSSGTANPFSVVFNNPRGSRRQASESLPRPASTAAIEGSTPSKDPRLPFLGILIRGSFIPRIASLLRTPSPSDSQDISKPWSCSWSPRS